jgi:hypothetical protein
MYKVRIFISSSSIKLFEVFLDCMSNVVPTFADRGSELQIPTAKVDTNLATSGGCSVGIVRSRTQATEFVCE